MQCLFWPPTAPALGADWATEALDADTDELAASTGRPTGLSFMIASRVIWDDTYSNNSWSIIGWMFQLRGINQMEHEVC